MAVAAPTLADAPTLDGLRNIQDPAECAKAICAEARRTGTLSPEMAALRVESIRSALNGDDHDWTAKSLAEYLEIATPRIYVLMSGG